jgi:hypothetical protein
MRLLDRLIAFVSPVWARRRALAFEREQRAYARQAKECRRARVDPFRTLERPPAESSSWLDRRPL